MKLADIYTRLNNPGVKLPLLYDPKTKGPSVSLTMLVISFNVVLIGLIGKWSKLAEGVDLPQAINWFLICAGLYFGRKTFDAKSTTSSDT